MKLISLLAVFAMVSSPLLQGSSQNFNAQPSKKQMAADLDFIQSVFEVQYAPKQWKYEHFQWDLSNQTYIAKEKVKNSNTLSVKEYQRILKNFLKSTSDFHVGASFHSTEFSELPFQVFGAKGRYFICYVDTMKEPIQVGDELISFGNKPIAQVIDDLTLNEIGNELTPSTRALAEFLLTFRSGKAGHIVPQGTISVTIKHQRTGLTKNYDLKWIYNPEKIVAPPVQNLMTAAKSATSETKPLISQDHPLLKKSMIGFGSELKKIPNIHLATNPYDLGQRQSYIPALGRKVWESDPKSCFHAYIYQNSQNKQIGYVRIPDYVPENVEQAVREFPEIITRMQNTTESLVIDQTNNPGGIVYYLYYLATHLSDKPLKTAQHKMTLTQREVQDALELIPLFDMVTTDQVAQMILGNSMFGYPVNLQMAKSMQKYFQFMIDEWCAGRTFTNPYPLYGLDALQPAKTPYTKPILMIVNPLCFSAADFFPALLQDNGVAKIFGARTGGAGGYVSSMVYPNLLGIDSIKYTASIAQRKDNQPLENLGVTPDISYEITPEDVQNGYKGYTQAINTAVDGLLKK